MQRVHLQIHGLVQGVFFRAHTQKEAAALGLAGWVRNTEDGGVEALAEGEKPALDAFVAWCRRGPERSRVDRVDVAWEPAQGDLRSFHIRA